MPDPSPQPCPRCDVLVREVSIGSGDDGLTMRACSGCDTTTWFRNGVPLDLTGVLRYVAKDEDFTLRPSPRRRGDA